MDLKRFSLCLCHCQHSFWVSGIIITMILLLLRSSSSSSSCSYFFFSKDNLTTKIYWLFYLCCMVDTFCTCQDAYPSPVCDTPSFRNIKKNSLRLIFLNLLCFVYKHLKISNLEYFRFELYVTCDYEVVIVFTSSHQENSWFPPLSKYKVSDF